MEKKILLVGPVPPPYGGIPKYVNDLLTSEYLNKKVSLKLFNTAIPENIRRYDKDNKRSYLSFLSDGFIPAIKLIIYTIFDILIKYPRNILNFKPSIIHIFTSSYWGFWRSCSYLLIGKIFKIKIYFHLLNAIDRFWNDSSSLNRLLISFFLNVSDRLIVQSNGIKRFVENVSTSEVISIYNGVNVKLYNSNVSLTQNNHDDFSIVFVGSVCKNKGAYDIIESAKSFNKDIKIIMVGACDKYYFEEYAKKEGVSNIVFTGVISELEKIKILKSSKIFILPSYAEGQPLSILEAMATGLPIISSTVGSIPEIIKNGINGFLVEPGDINGIVQFVENLYSDKDIRTQISVNNRKTAKKLYDIERMIINISDLYI